MELDKTSKLSVSYRLCGSFVKERNYFTENFGDLSYIHLHLVKSVEKTKLQNLNIQSQCGVASF